MLFGKSSFVGREVSLVVKECLPEDAGAYTCVAENTAGKTSSSAAVCVRGKYVLKFNFSLKCILCSEYFYKSIECLFKSMGLPGWIGDS